MIQVRRVRPHTLPHEPWKSAHFGRKVFLLFKTESKYGIVVSVVQLWTCYLAKALKECDEEMSVRIFTSCWRYVVPLGPQVANANEVRVACLRASMAQERLSLLVLLYTHCQTDIDLDGVVDVFAKKHPRRLELVTLLKGQQSEWMDMNCMWKYVCIIVIV